MFKLSTICFHAFFVSSLYNTENVLKIGLRFIFFFFFKWCNDFVLNFYAQAPKLHGCIYNVQEGNIFFMQD